jgi:hypothetical protein
MIDFKSVVIQRGASPMAAAQRACSPFPYVLYVTAVWRPAYALVHGLQRRPRTTHTTYTMLKYNLMQRASPSEDPKRPKCSPYLVGPACCRPSYASLLSSGNPATNR